MPRCLFGTAHPLHHLPFYSHFLLDEWNSINLTSCDNIIMPSNIRWGQDEDCALLELIIRLVPTCGTEWTKVMLEHVEAYEHRDLGSAEKTTQAIRRRYNLLVRRSKKKPTGDPNIPPELAYAREASKAIIARAGIEGLPSDDSDFGESGEEKSDDDDDESSKEKKPAAKSSSCKTKKTTKASKARKPSAAKKSSASNKHTRPINITSTPLVQRRASAALGRDTPSFAEVLQMQSIERAEREDRRFRMEQEQRQREAEDRRQHQMMMMAMMTSIIGGLGGRMPTSMHPSMPPLPSFDVSNEANINSSNDCSDQEEEM